MELKRSKTRLITESCLDRQRRGRWPI